MKLKKNRETAAAEKARLQKRIAELEAQLAAEKIRRPMIGCRTPRPMMSLATIRPPAFPVRQAVGGSELDLFGEIGEGGVDAKQFRETFRALPRGPVTINLFSPGGDVFDGIAIYETIRERRNDTTIRVGSLAASIAAVIAMAGKRLLMSKSAFLMIHLPWSHMVGNAAEIRKTAALLDQLTSTTGAIFAEKTGLPLSKFVELMEVESWFDGTQAVEMGFADGIIADTGGGLESSLRGSPALASAVLKFRKAPAALRRIAASIVGTSSGTTDPALDEFTKREAEAVRQWKDSPAQRELRRFTESEKLALAEHKMLSQK